MVEYVDRTKLKERIRYDFGYSLQLCEDIIESIDELPTIEIVHCENCIHREYDTYFCLKHKEMFNPDYFCADGVEPLHSERKE